MGDQLVQLEAVDRAALPRLIVGRIRDFMTDKRLQSEDRIPPERVLMDQLRAGRSSVREALEIPSTLGVVGIRRGDGAYVSMPSRPWNLQAPAFLPAPEKNALRDIVELRRTIEPMAAGLAAERATDDDIADLRALLEGHQRRPAADPGWHWEPLEVEPAIAESTGNMLPVQMQRTLRGLWVGHSRGFRGTADHTAEWLHEHWVIRDAITARHATRATPCCSTSISSASSAT